MKGLIKLLIFFGALSYGIYYVLHLPDVTVIPPTKNDVKKAMWAVSQEFSTRGGLQVNELCTRVGGTWYKNGVFKCKVYLHDSYVKALGKSTVTIVKKNGKWVWKDKPQLPLDVN